MRDAGRNTAPAAAIRAYARDTGTALHVVELDVVINNAGHLYVGYVEAFTDDDITHLIDVNASAPTESTARYCRTSASAEPVC
ncbi:hypothetical protein [Virgisporangium aliadipatigenens]|nr:hypothetical protein [Virgisporangium aliadipatigenens]